MKTRITELFGIKHPIILAGMSFVTEPHLVATISNTGGLGILAGGGHTPDELREGIREIRSLTDKPFGVNVTLFLPGASELIGVILDEKVPVVNYALGRAVEIIKAVHGYGGKIIATVATEKHALRSEQDGADAVTITCYEAAAHAGNIGALVMIPTIASQVKIPVIGAGGFCDGKGLAAALVLGAEGISMGTRFALTKECVVHDYFKQEMIKATVEDTIFSDRFDGLLSRALKTKASEAIVKRRLPLVRAVMDALRFKRELNLSLWELTRGALRMGKIEKISMAKLPLIPVGMSELKRAVLEGDERTVMLAGQNCGRINDLPTCSELIEQIVAEAEEVLEAALEKAHA